ncbi:transglycosylase SLT domain-containing protein [Nitrospirillum pindoramense]|uniref:Transglycosylase-like protein with SLT domain n=1 Tax=Nitrospirillum amazonense TaxID=28077 RepID=A0A560H4L7_9PROT|nr:transglycosylase SLT domain-containing protein [Nitrospirillum amazonense]TWB40560.1 transglycosylase-like protein with SLT domain [Nitrospirillum amazonense]
MQIARRQSDALLGRESESVSDSAVRPALRSFKTAIAGLVIGLGLMSAAPAGAACLDHILQAEKEAGVPSGLLLAVALVESGQSISSEAYAVNVKGTAHFVSTPTAAAKYLRDPKGNLRQDVTAGCMQLSLSDHKAAFHPVEKIVDPKENVQYAARMLARLRATAGSWAAAVARYNGGSGKTAHAYACKVRSNLVSLNSINASLIDGNGCSDEASTAVTPRTRRVYQNATSEPVG